MGRVGWTIKEKELLLSNYCRVPLEDLLSYLSRTKMAVRIQAQKLSITGRTFIRYNEKFFSVPNLTASYWAGFIAADGCVGRETGPNKGVKIKINKADEDRLELLKSQIKFSGKIYNIASCTFIRNGKVSNHQPGVVLNLGGKAFRTNRLKKDLSNNYGIVHLKTNTNPEFTLNKLNLENQLAFIAGLIDGDGSFVLDRKKYFRIQLTGSKKILIWVARLFRKLSKYSVRHVSRVKQISTNGFYYQFSGRNARMIFKKIKSLNLEVMRRKWNIRIPKVDTYCW